MRFFCRFRCDFLRKKGAMRFRLWCDAIAIPDSNKQKKSTVWPKIWPTFGDTAYDSEVAWLQAPWSGSLFFCQQRARVQRTKQLGRLRARTKSLWKIVRFQSESKALRPVYTWVELSVTFVSFVINHWRLTSMNDNKWDWCEEGFVAGSFSGHEGRWRYIIRHWGPEW